MISSVYDSLGTGFHYCDDDDDDAIYVCDAVGDRISVLTLLIISTINIYQYFCFITQITK